MKRKRIAAALLALAVMLTLAGCGSFAGRMAGAVRKMEKVQSCRVDLSLDTALNITVLGREMPAELAVNASGDVNTKPGRSRLELTRERGRITRSISPRTEAGSGQSRRLILKNRTQKPGSRAF